MKVLKSQELQRNFIPSRNLLEDKKIVEELMEKIPVALSEIYKLPQAKANPQIGKAVPS